MTNPKYIGNNVSNRRSSKLRSPRRWNPPDMWIRRDSAFEGLVDPALYRRAESVAAARSRPQTDDELLQLLRAFLKRHQHVTARMIGADPAMPCTQVYRERFGSLTEAYRRVGYTVGRDMSYIERDRKLSDVRRDFSTRIANELRRLKATATYDWQSKKLTVNDSLSVRLVVTRCRSLGDSYGWLLRLGSSWDPDATVIGRLAPGNGGFMDYFLLRPRNIRGLTQLTLRPGESSAFEKYRYDDLSFLRNVIRWSRNRKLGTT